MNMTTERIKKLFSKNPNANWEWIARKIGRPLNDETRERIEKIICPQKTLDKK